MNFTALVLITSSLQTTPATVASISEPAIEMVHQAADRRTQSRSSESGSRSSSTASKCLRRAMTTLSLSSRMRDEMNNHNNNNNSNNDEFQFQSSPNSSTIDLSPRSSSDFEAGSSDELDNSSAEDLTMSEVRGRRAHRKSSYLDLQRRGAAKLTKRRDPRDFMRQGMTHHRGFST